MIYQGERETYDAALAQMTAEGWFDNLPWDVKVLTERCPHCNNGMVWYEHEYKTSDGSTYVVGSHCGCTWCDATWYDSVSFFGAGQAED